MKSANAHIVIVYLGKKIPRYVFANMANISKNFCEVPKTLIISPSVKLPETPQGWSVWVYHESASDRDLLSRMELPENFRKGFWKYSYQRFFALSQFHEEIEATPLLQIEADVVILPNFPIEQISGVEKMAWMPLEEGEDIPSLVYSPLCSETQFLANYFRAQLEVNPKTSDMRSLFSLRLVHPDRICLLPDSPRTQNESLGPGFFDAATLGIWLLGNDPRNEKGWRRTGIKANPRHFLRIESLEFKVISEAVYVSEGDGNWLPLWSIHVHSKLRRFFLQRELLREIDSRSKSIHTKSFHLGSFFNWVLEILRDLLSAKGKAGLKSRIRRVFYR